LEHTIEISAVGHGGAGIGRIDGRVCFVPFALPGDTVRIAIAREAKGVLWGRILEVVKPSEHRLDVEIPNFEESGACAWLHFAYPAQAEWKQRIVRDSFERIAKMECEVGWRENPELRTAYRTRAIFHGDAKNVGYYAPGSHDIVAMEACPLSHARVNEVLRELRKVRFKGEVTVTVNPEGQEVLLWTRFAKEKLPPQYKMVDSPAENKKRNGFIFDGVPVVNGCFAQNSLLLNRVLRECVSEAVGAPKRVLDLYCGSGNFSIALKNAEVRGVDHNRHSIYAAAKLRPEAYKVGDEIMMARYLQKEAWELIIVNPPRAGAKSLQKALQFAQSPKMVYVSCDPATLARDVKEYCMKGWKLRSVTAVDMFPNTPHVETVCVLEREDKPRPPKKSETENAE